MKFNELDKKVRAILLLVIMLVLVAVCAIVYKTNGKDVAKEEASAAGDSTSLSVADNLPVIRDSSQYVTLGQYRGLPITTEKETVTEDAVAETLDKVLDSYGGYYVEDEEGKVDEGDSVSVLLCVVSSEEDAYDDAAAQELSFRLGIDDYPEEFTKPLIGHLIDDIVFIELSEEEKYQVKVSHIHKKGTPPDDFIESLGIEGVTTLNSLKDLIREYLETNYDEKYVSAAKEELIGTAYDNCLFADLPDDYVQTFKDKLQSNLDTLVNTYAEQGETVTYDDVLAEIYERDGISTVAEYLDYYGKQAAKVTVMCSAIAKAEDFDIDNTILYSLAAADWVTLTEDYPTLKDYLAANDISAYENAALLDTVKDFLYNVAEK